MTADDPAPDVSAEGRRPTPEMIAAAWRAFRGDRKGMLLGPGPAFVEAIEAAMEFDTAHRKRAIKGGENG